MFVVTHHAIANIVRMIAYFVILELLPIVNKLLIIYQFKQFDLVNHNYLFIDLFAILFGFVIIDQMHQQSAKSFQHFYFVELEKILGLKIIAVV